MNIFERLNLKRNPLENAIIYNLAVAPINPEKGLMYFDITFDKLGIYNGTTWDYLGINIPSLYLGKYLSNTQFELINPTGVDGNFAWICSNEISNAIPIQAWNHLVIWNGEVDASFNTTYSWKYYPISQEDLQYQLAQLQNDMNLKLAAKKTLLNTSTGNNTNEEILVVDNITTPTLRHIINKLYSLITDGNYSSYFEKNRFSFLKPSKQLSVSHHLDSAPNGAIYDVNYQNDSGDIALTKNIDTAITNLKDGVTSAGDTLQKLYNLILTSISQDVVADITARNLYNIPHVPFNLFVTNDGDGRWATYTATTTGVGATFVKTSDPDLLNAVLSNSAIKTAYESNADTNAFTNALLAKLNAITGTNTGDETTSSIKSKLGITTLSGSNTGDQDLSKFPKILASKGTYGSIITGTVSESILEQFTIPAGELVSGNIVNISNNTWFNGGYQSKLRWRISNTNSLAGATQIGYSPISSQWNDHSRRIWVVGSNIEVMTPTYEIAADSGSFPSTYFNRTTITIDLTQPIYVFITCANTNGLSSVRSIGYTATKY